MSEYPLPKDPMMAAYLQHLRDRNVKQAERCQHCNEKTTGINSDGYRIIFVCDKHTNNYPRVKVIDDMPNVVHRVYPDGLDVPKHMMNPNIGGFLGKKSEGGK